jgi:HK97 family phage major capsid protein
MSANPKQEETNKSWTPEQLEKFIETVCGKVVASSLKDLQDRVTKYGNWIDGANATQPQLHERRSAEEIAKDKGLVFGGFLSAMAGSRCDLEKAVRNAKEIVEKSKTARDKSINEQVMKALEASTGSAGGFLIPTQESSDFIDLLTPRAIVRSFGTSTLDMDSGTIQIQKLNAGSTAYYIGETRDATASQQDFGMKKLTARKLAVLVPISNDLIRRGGPKVNAIVRNDALRSASLKEDVTFIRSQGGEFTPKGLRYLAKSEHVIAATSGYNLAKVTFDLGRMVLLMEEANVAFGNPGWMFAPRTKQYLMTVRDGNGNYAFRAEMLTGRLWGYPFKTTTQIPRNLGVGSNLSEIYLVDFDDVIIGQTLGVEVALSTEASYIDPVSGEFRNAFTQDLTLLRVLMEHDIQIRYDASIVVLTDVDWEPTA